MMTPLDKPQIDIELHDGQLRLVNKTYEDIYFSPKNGMEETNLVYLKGNDLEARMRKAERFVVAETGFGTGLNLLMLLKLWQSLGDEAPHLHYITTENAPLEPDVISKALSIFPELIDLLPELIAILPPRWAGRHHRYIFGGKVSVDFLYGDALEMLTASSFKADAWFLDGFAPDRNPAMWQPALFKAIERCSTGDATLASFTAAKDVQMGLTEAGFDVTVQSGQPFKDSRITAKRNPKSQKYLNKNINNADQRIVIIGTGVAGASVAAGLIRQGITPLVLGRGDGPHDGASGNMVAVQVPFLAAKDITSSRLSLTAFSYARWLARHLDVSIDDTAMVYGWNEREEIRQKKIDAMGHPDCLFVHASVDDAQNHTGLDAGLSGFVFPEGGSINPRAMCQAMLEGAETRYGITVEGFEQIDGRWHLHTDQEDIIADKVVLATGAGLKNLTRTWLDPLLNLQVTAGRVSHLPSSVFPDLQSALSFGGYLARSHDGAVALGASFDRDIDDDIDPYQETVMTSDDHANNLGLLPEALRGEVPALSAWEGRVSYRLAAEDRQPIAGEVQDGLFILAALGSRGMVTGPLLGEYITSLLTGVPSPLDRDMAALVNPFRFSAKAGL